MYWTNKAKDRVDFNPGDVFAIPGTDIIVEDDLFNECFGHKDYDLTSTEAGNEKDWSWSCD